MRLRAWLIGLSISQAGTWIGRVALAHLVWRLTGSAEALGVVAFAGQLPALLLSPLSGALVDRWDLRRLLLTSQLLSGAQSAALAALALSGIAGIPALALLAACRGAASALDTPARQALLLHLVHDRRDLGRAIAWSASVVHATRVAGPVVGGLVIVASAEGACFLVDAASCLAPAAVLLHLRLPPAPLRQPAPVLREVVDGLRWVRHSARGRRALLLLAALAALGMPHAVLLPAVAGDPATLGLLTSASGAGALAGALWLTRRTLPVRLEPLIALAALAFGGGLVALALAPDPWLSLLSLLLAGAGIVVCSTGSNTLLQGLVDERLRGRILSLHAMAFFGAAPVGAWVAGCLADLAGARVVIGAGGVLCVVAAAGYGSGVAPRSESRTGPGRCRACPRQRLRRARTPAARGSRC